MILYQAWKYRYSSYNGLATLIILESIFREQTNKGLGKLTKITYFKSQYFSALAFCGMSSSFKYLGNLLITVLVMNL